MRRLGRELGVEAMSIYNHVPSREALVDGLVEAVLDEVAASDDDDWQEALRSLARSFRRAAARHPEVVRLFANRTLAIPAWRRSVEDTLRVLRRAGFAPREAVAAYRVFWAYLSGYLFGELRLQGAPSLSEYLGELSVEDFPAMHDLASELAGTDRDAEYDLGVDLLLEAFARRLR
jgi:AcrR family transcriptional regulator